MTVDAGQVAAELQRLSGPLVALMKEVEAGIEHHEQELAALREQRQLLLPILRRVAPDEYAPPDPKKPAKKPAAAKVASDETVERLRRWLVENREEINAGDGVYVTGLIADPDFTVITSRETLSAALAQLHEHGVLRIDSIGVGKRKNYKLV